MANSLEQTIALLKETDDAARRAKVTLESLTQQMMKNPSQTVQANFADELARINSLYDRHIALLKQVNVLMRERNNLANLSSGAGPATGHIAGGATETAASGESTSASIPVVEETAAQRKRAEREKLVALLKQERQAWLEANEAMLSYVKTQGILNPADAYKGTSREAGAAYGVSTFKERNAMGEFNTLKVREDQMGGYSNVPVKRQSQSFTQGVGKDIGDLLKWSLAISAIYGPINAASTAIAGMVENETKLADVSIALNSNLADTGKVFSDVYTAAQKSGESVSLVIDAFGAAYTAAGRITDGVDRYNATIGLLDDSLALSKLSTLDQAQAIDVLTAALYQTGDANASNAEKLSRGKDLLDQWILVTKNASVTVETLATGVAVLGDTAETAGLSLEQLNALVATISEVSLSSGKETANIAKALVGNYQQPSAVKELNRLGIAVVDTTGKTRQFLDVMKDVAGMRTTGLIGNEDFSRLTLALGGGGIRRQADVAKFLENFGRMDQLVKIQEAGAGGETAAALAKKMDTVQTASTKLQNSLLNLAQTFGTEGGLLDVFSSTLSLGSDVADVFDKIASAVGKVGPLLLAAGLSSFMLGQGGLAGATSKLATNVTGPLANRFGFTGTGAGMGLASTLTGQQSIFGGMGGYGTGMNFGARMTTLPTLAAIGLPAAQNFKSGDSAEGWANIAGGTLGAMLSGPIGALAGSAIAEAFVRTTMTYDSAFVDLFAGKVQPPEQLTKPKDKPLEDVLSDVYKEIGGGNELVGKFKAWIEELRVRQVSIGGETPTDWRAPGSYATTDAAALALLEKTNPQAAKSARFALSRAGLTPESYETGLVKKQKEIATPQTLGYLGSLQKTESDKLKLGVISGDIKQSDYANRLQSISAFGTQATKWMAALTDESGNVSDAFSSDEEAYKSFLSVISSGNQETINGINATIAEISALQDQIDNWDGVADIKLTVNGENVDVGIGAAKSALQNLQTDILPATIINAQQQAIRDELTRSIVPVYGGNVNPQPKADLEVVNKEYQAAFSTLYSDLTEAEKRALIAGFEPFKVLVKEAGNVFYETISGKSKELWGEMFQEAQKRGTIASPSADLGLGFSALDVTSGQLKKAVSQANNLTGQLVKKGYKANVEDTLIATSDNQISKQHVDMKILQYILQQILDTEKKQLQGVWNLPEGASFWVPLQSIIDDYKGGGGKGGFPKITAPDAAYGTSTAVADTVAEVIAKHPTTILHGGEGTSKYVGLYPRDEGKGRPTLAGTQEMSSIDKLLLYLNKPTTAMPAYKGYGRGVEDKVETAMDKLLEFLKGGAKTATDPLKDTLPKFDTAIDRLLEFLGGGKKQPSAPTDLLPKLDGTLEKLMDFFKNLSPFGKSGSGYDTLGKKTEAAPQVNKVDLNLTTTTNLMVDGRILASIVKPYLAADLLKATQSAGGFTRRFVM